MARAMSFLERQLRHCWKMQYRI